MHVFWGGDPPLCTLMQKRGVWRADLPLNSGAHFLVSATALCPSLDSLWWGCVNCLLMYFSFLSFFLQAYRDESHTVDLAKAEADAKVREIPLCSTWNPTERKCAECPVCYADFLPKKWLSMIHSPDARESHTVKLDLTRGRDTCCRPKGSQSLETRMMTFQSVKWHVYCYNQPTAAQK